MRFQGGIQELITNPGFHEYADSYLVVKRFKLGVLKKYLVKLAKQSVNLHQSFSRAHFVKN